MTTFELATLVASGLALALGLFIFVNERGLRRRSDRTKAMELLDEAYFHLRKAVSGSAESRDRFDACVELAEAYTPSHRRVALYRGYVYELDGDLVRAEREFRRSLARNSEDGQAWLQMARIAKGEEKITRLQRARQYERTRGQALTLLSEQYRTQRHGLELAREAIEEALATSPKRCKTNAEMAKVLWAEANAENDQKSRRQKLDEARSSFDRAVEHATDTEVGDAVSDLGQFIASTDGFKEGVQFLERAVPGIPPGDGTVLTLLAALYADEALQRSGADRVGLASKALERAHAAIAADPRGSLASIAISEVQRNMEKLLRDDVASGDVVDCADGSPARPQP